MAVLGSAHPMIPIRDNYKNIVNEAVILFILDMLLFSSDPNIDVPARGKIGWAMIVVLGLSLVQSQGSLILDSCH